jgi:geranylgeranyl diphosphate synthase type II
LILTVTKKTSNLEISVDIKQYIEDKRGLVDTALNKYMLSEEGSLAEHIKAMRYSIFAGGKRVRPILCLAAAEAVLPEDEKLPKMSMITACALECIHTYSLIHDDLPAMDDDDLRRGKPTNHMVFGEAGAILAGDGLLTFAFELLSTPVSNELSAQDRLRIISTISKAAGPIGMVGGQALDLENEGKMVDFTTLQNIHSRKTGALITASVQAGAILGRSSDEQFEALSLYGEKVGLAFQIVDDLLNVEGTEEQLGKAAGSDAARQKATYPAFFGVEETRKKASAAVQEAITSLDGFNQQADPLRELAQYIFTRKR